MPSKGPHISIASESLAPRILGLEEDVYKELPESVRELGLAMAEELFLVRYNPYIDPAMVRSSVKSRLDSVRHSLSTEYIELLENSLTRFWNEFEDDQRFRDALIKRMKKKMGNCPDCIETRRGALVECATDATDLRMELPMMVVAPRTTEQIRAVVRLANEMEFSIIPRGGGSGLTGGAVPARRRTVILSLTKLKHIEPIDETNCVLRAQAGVITLDAINAAKKKGLLFTVDPASKAASSIGGNISENSGGPFAFEYGTTLDNILSYKMVTPTAEIIEVRRADHPRHKILPDETVIFEVMDERGNVRERIEMLGKQFRGPGLGKDVTDKFLGGLPGVQKEGVDGVITEGSFVLHNLPNHSRTLCLEFFGRSMHNAMLVIKDLIGLRDTIRKLGDRVKMSALEEFGVKYVQAIDYQKKSTTYEGDPISVLLVQLDSDDESALDWAVQQIQAIVHPYDQVDVFAAQDEREAEIFWEDRHKLSAISRRTSGFKINEDIVIPTDVIPEFSDFLEDMNLSYMARAYRSVLQQIGQDPRFAVEDKDFNREFSFASRIMKGEVGSREMNDQELELRAWQYVQSLKEQYPQLAEDLDKIYQDMQATRIVIANHMHAGDGNCHVNIPVNSNDPAMLAMAHEAAETVMAKAQELNGEVTGEHGIGITKIGFLSEEKMEALRQFKRKVDPKDVLNPGKLTQRSLPATPYTFSFNRLIRDIRESGLPEKKRLIELLQNVQVCTRCGKCKQVCPMYYPERSMLFHPRNRNISLGALIEAIYYTQVNTGEPDPALMQELRRLMDHCTACGKCTAVCPVKINTPQVTLHLRHFLEEKGHGGHPVKSRVLSYLAGDPAHRIPRAARMAARGQSLMNRALGVVPGRWRGILQNPMLSGPGPELGPEHLGEQLHLQHGSLLVPAGAKPAEVETALYFPGCGAGLFFSDIGLAVIGLLLHAGRGVLLPPEHLCCGYPLLVSGSEQAFETNQARNVFALRKLLDQAQTEDLSVSAILTACGSCRDGLERYGLEKVLGRNLLHQDATQFLLERLEFPEPHAGKLLYHAACHAEWTGVPSTKAAEAYRSGLSQLTGAEVELNPGCCGESGLGAISSPEIYGKLRQRKQQNLQDALPGYHGPVLVGCPSCKIGVSRSMMALKDGREVLHTMEYLARTTLGQDWRENIAAAVTKSRVEGSGRRMVDIAGL